MNHKIPAGILSNFDTLLMRIKNLKEMRSYVTSESFDSLTKKEQNMKKRALEKVEKVYKGVVNLRKKPGLVIILDGQLMHKFVKEVVSTKTNAIVLVSSNFNLYTEVQLVTCNVNSQRSVDYVLQSITK
jgi:small subunit ribosomal protein S2